MNVYLGEHYEEFIRKQVATGKYASAAEVIRDALREKEQKLNHEYVRDLLAEAIDDVNHGRVYKMAPDFWDHVERDADEDERNGVPIPDHVKY